MVSARTFSTSDFLKRGCLLTCVVVLTVCSSGTAWASCGDYLHGDHYLRGNHSLDVSMLPEHSVPDQSLPGPVCSGPHCKQHQPLPIGPSQAIEIPTPSDVILASLFKLNFAESRSANGRLRRVLLAEAPADAIFKPPRR